jgi:hypothetical protein
MFVAQVWLSFLGGAVAVEPVEIDGPWTRGSYATVAHDGDRLHAAWLDDDDKLRYATSEDAGATWSKSRTVAHRVESGDNGQIRPELVVAATGPAVGFVRNGQPTLATLEHGRWHVRFVRSTAPGSGSLMDVGVVGGVPVVVWLDTRRDPASHVSEVRASVGDREELVYDGGSDGVCMCCRPVVADVAGIPTVAVRDADGALREARVFARDTTGAWVDQGAATHGGWSPGGCPSDGPVVTAAGHVLISDGRTGERAVYDGDEAVVAVEGAAVVQPRSVGEHRVWVEASAGRLRLVADGVQLAEAAGRLEPGDPIVIDGALWVPWQGDRAHLTVLPATR